MRKVILESFMDNNLEKIKSKLLEEKLIGAEDQICFIPMVGAFLRKDYREMQKYIVEINSAKKYIVRISKDLKLLVEKHKLISKDFKDLIPEIILYNKDVTFDFLLEEFIEGETLESIIKKNPERENEIIQMVLVFHKSLNDRVTNSTYEKAREEIDELLNQISHLNYVTDVDCALIRTIIQPEINKLLAKRNMFQKRISQGDFIDKNIILTKIGSLRIVDLEFARETHFYKEEMIRFYNHSTSLSTKINNQSIADKSDEIYSLLNQIRLLDETHKEFIAPPSFDHQFHHTLEIIRIESDDFAYSRIVKLLNGDFLRLTQRISELDKQIIEKEQKISALLNSYTWKLGYFLLWPIRKIVLSFKS